MRIDPWVGQQFADYARLRDEFGIEPFDPWVARMPKEHPLFSRGIVFGHRGFDLVHRAIERREPWAVLTGLMPSGKMHLGHKMVIDQVAYWQSLGADVTLAVADLEAYATRNVTLRDAARLAEEEYLANYLALGLKPESFRVYFQSRRQPVKNLGFLAGRKLTWSTMQSIYGFEPSVNLAHVQSPLVQVGDILHVQLPDYGGPRPTLVPVGVDQDPHIRLTRDLAAALRLFNVQWADKDGLGLFLKADKDFGNVLALIDRIVPDVREREKLAAKPAEERNAALVKRLFKMAERFLEKQAGVADFRENLPYQAAYMPGARRDDAGDLDARLATFESELGVPAFVPPAATYHRFMSGLTGSKMSSSKPETSVFLTDPPDAAVERVKGAKTGGRATAEEQRKLGGEWDKCVVAEMYLYHLSPDAKDLKEKFEKCTTGARLCGECKGIAAERTRVFLKEHQERYAGAREEASRLVKEALAEGAAGVA